VVPISSICFSRKAGRFVSSITWNRRLTKMGKPLGSTQKRTSHSQGRCASSRTVYNEGAALCEIPGHVAPSLRPAEQFRAGDFPVHCPQCGRSGRSIRTEGTSGGGGPSMRSLRSIKGDWYCCWGKQTGIPTLALRYSCTYGPSQSLFNRYTGAFAIIGRM
jgi:hypothetical protein